VNPEDFARFLKLLSDDSEEAGRRYDDLQRKLTGFFSLKGLSDPGSAADETIDRAVLKIAAGAEVPDVSKYCFGIARNLAKEKLRISQREHSAYHKFTEDLSHSSAEQVERIYNLLKPCFRQLAIEEQQLLQAYCHDLEGRSRAKHRQELAETLKISMLALRVRVTRLRNSLTDCVRRRSANAETRTPDA
jgi:DNA-directed RNA polymerase specialized sigma24 family protein